MQYYSIFLIYLKIATVLCYFWSDVDRTTSQPSAPSNLGCFMCTQLLSVTKHRVGLSENQLRNQLYEKCRVLPSVFKDDLQDQCFTFVETSLPEIYFSLNYDLSSKDVCVRLNFCEETNPFAVGGPLPPIEPETYSTILTSTTRTSTLPSTTTSTTSAPPSTTTTTIAHTDRIGHKNVLEILLPSGLNRNSIEVETTQKPEIVDDKRMTCEFCERMLENAKDYAVTSKADITSFANSACASLPKGRTSDQCYQMADKKIAELAKFVDQQVVDALWCAEVNRC
ncbi:unnamed protein product [Caenorhabditis angaria]|uniref:Saposin B-type domain-containing protein n=1 Tax=Caenorhabditis angaria TaxID=860376 RepID=A0A9P1N5C5_9PELO|nr:unnamed protein product [Caenorhabditis angaria]